MRDEALEARLQHVARDPQVGLHLVETVHAQQGLPDDQHRPALADDLQGGGDAARLAGVGALQGHAASVVDCVA